MIEIKWPKPLASWITQPDSESGDYAVLDAGWNRAELKDFFWDDLMVEANKEGAP